MNKAFNTNLNSSYVQFLLVLLEIKKAMVTHQLDITTTFKSFKGSCDFQYDVQNGDDEEEYKMNINKFKNYALQQSKGEKRQMGCFSTNSFSHS